MAECHNPPRRSCRESCASGFAPGVAGEGVAGEGVGMRNVREGMTQLLMPAWAARAPARLDGATRRAPGPGPRRRQCSESTRTAGPHPGQPPGSQRGLRAALDAVPLGVALGVPLSRWVPRWLLPRPGASSGFLDGFVGFLDGLSIVRHRTPRPGSQAATRQPPGGY